MPGITITDEKGISTIIEYDAKGSYHQTVVFNMPILQNVLNGYFDMGYKIVSSTAIAPTGSQLSYSITTYILAKE